MKPELQAIISELEILVRHSSEDFSKQFWANYTKYLEEYNALLGRTQATGLFTEMKPIQHVPFEEKAAYGINYSQYEKAKLREIVNEAEKLLQRLRTAGDLRPASESSLDRIEQICQRFHLVVRQLQNRHDNRSTLKIEDEYDVQDLVHALLKVEFDDVRPEERTPSYAGGSSRMDFLLKPEQIVVEIKKTRRGLDVKEIGEQLIVDIERYSQHSDCKTLFCFVYDPEGRIENPRGVESDLESKHKGEPKVKVFIRPTGE